MPDRALVALRTGEARLVDRVASAIQAEVPAYAGAERGDLRAEIVEIVGVAVREAIELAEGKPRLDVGAAAVMHRIGWSEAVGDGTLEPLRAAFEVAAREGWIELHRISRDQKLSAAELGQLGDILFVLVGGLREAAQSGHRDGRVAKEADVVVARERFVRHVLGVDTGDDVERLGVMAGWPPPARSLVLCLGVPPNIAQISEGLSDAGAFVLVEGDCLVVLCDERDRDDSVDRVQASVEATPICVSPPAAPMFLPDALRLARRAHGLIGQRVIAPADIVDCAEHMATLWLQAEPLLRQQTVSRFLAPFQTLRAQRRQVLASTLAMWLEHHGSAPAIGERLGVHPQTVRYRLRQLEDLVGKQLEDPDVAFMMLMGLKASLPLWAAELPTSRGPAN